MATQTQALDDSAELKVEEKLETNPPAEPKIESESKDSVDAIKESEKTPVVEETVEESAKEVTEKPLEGESVSRDVEEAKQETITEEALIKPVKQSNNLISKVKQSLVKAKKAILGKSAAPPTSVSTETKA